MVLRNKLGEGSRFCKEYMLMTAWFMVMICDDVVVMVG
jgi:hypothetical protein